jgi:prevent-host-death family protein
VFVRTPNEKGAIGEAVIAASATKLGIVVSRPIIDARYDLIFDTGHELFRVQCKWGALDRDGGVVKVNLTSSWCTPAGYARTTYSAGEIDLIGVYCGELDTCYLLPAALLVGRRAIWLRLAPPRNRQKACVNLASDFTFDGAVAQLARATRWQRVGRGFESPQLHSASRDPAVQTVGTNEFRNRFGWYMERAATGEVFHVTRHGRPFVRLIPALARQPELGDAPGIDTGEATAAAGS